MERCEVHLGLVRSVCVINCCTFRSLSFKLLRKFVNYGNWTEWSTIRISNRMGPSKIKD